MKKLADIQSSFQKALLAPQPSVPANILGNSTHSAEEMFGIYRRAYSVRLKESLGADFPGLKALLGEKKFDEFVERYINLFPSTYSSIRWFGNDFVHFLQNLPQAQSDNPLSGDMAALDWAAAHAFDAPDKTPATIGDLLTLPPELWDDLEIEFHPSLSIVMAKTGLMALRTELMERESDEQKSMKDAVTFILRQEMASVMIWRLDLDIKYREIENDEAKAQKLMAEGKTFGELCETIAQDIEDPLKAAEKGAFFLKTWVDWGTLIDFKIAGKPLPAQPFTRT